MCPIPPVPRTEAMDHHFRLAWSVSDASASYHLSIPNREGGWRVRCSIFFPKILIDTIFNLHSNCPDIPRSLYDDGEQGSITINVALLSFMLILHSVVSVWAVQSTVQFTFSSTTQFAAEKMYLLWWIIRVDSRQTTWDSCTLLSAQRCYKSSSCFIITMIPKQQRVHLFLEIHFCLFAFKVVFSLVWFVLS